MIQPQISCKRRCYEFHGFSRCAPLARADRGVGKRGWECGAHFRIQGSWTANHSHRNALMSQIRHGSTCAGAARKRICVTYHEFDQPPAAHGTKSMAGNCREQSFAKFLDSGHVIALAKVNPIAMPLRPQRPSARGCKSWCADIAATQQLLHCANVCTGL